MDNRLKLVILNKQASKHTADWQGYQKMLNNDYQGNALKITVNRHHHLTRQEGPKKA